MWIWLFLMCDGLIADASVAFYELRESIDCREFGNDCAQQKWRDVIRWREDSSQILIIQRESTGFYEFSLDPFPSAGDRSKTKTKINQSTSAASGEHRLSGSISKCHWHSASFRDGNKIKVEKNTRENEHNFRLFTYGEAECEKKCVKVDQRRWLFQLYLDEKVKLGEEKRK